jgi:hypothetical protein
MAYFFKSELSAVSPLFMARVLVLISWGILSSYPKDCRRLIVSASAVGTTETDLISFAIFFSLA